MVQRSLLSSENGRRTYFFGSVLDLLESKFPLVAQATWPVRGFSNQPYFSKACASELNRIFNEANIQDLIDYQGWWDYIQLSKQSPYFESQQLTNIISQLADSTEARLLVYLSNLQTDSIPNEGIYFEDKYLIAKDKKNIEVYLLEKDVEARVYLPPVDNGIKLWRTVTDSELDQILSSPDEFYEISENTSFSDPQNDYQAINFSQGKLLVEITQTPAFVIPRFTTVSAGHYQAAFSHLAAIDRVLWNNTWYDSLQEFKDAYTKLPQQ